MPEGPTHSRCWKTIGRIEDHGQVGTQGPAPDRRKSEGRSVLSQLSRKNAAEAHREELK